MYPTIRPLYTAFTLINKRESIRKAPGEISNQHKLAAKLIEILQKDLPDFLLSANEGALKKKFENKGFKLTTKDPQYTNFNSKG
jgi:hypothetical protein